MVSFQAFAASGEVPVSFGKSYRMLPPPSYALCTGASDATDLTDGKLAPHEDIWQDPLTVGWKFRSGSAVLVDVDLEQSCAIEKIRFHTTAGKAGTTWPSAIYVYTSNDREQWHYGGDLLTKAATHSPLPDVLSWDSENDGVNVSQKRWIESSDWSSLKPARYVLLAIRTDGMLIFSDEIEIYGKPLPAESQPAGEMISGYRGVDEHVQSLVMTGYFTRRVKDDLAALTLSAERLDKAERTGILGKIKELNQEADGMPPQAWDSFASTRLPLNPFHQKILAIQAELWRAEGAAPLAIWKGNRFDQLPLIHSLERTEPELLLRPALQQRANDAVFLSNATSDPLKVEIRYQNKDGSITALPQGISLSEGVWADTKSGIPVNNALEPLKDKDGVFEIRLAPGMTTRLWISASQKEAGKEPFTGKLVFDAGEVKGEATIHYRPSPVDVGPQSLSVILWDYIDGAARYGITDENQAKVRALVRDRFQIIPWGSSAVLPRPEARDFDEDDGLVTPLDFSRFDRWISEIYPDQKRYGIFLIGTELFAGKKIGDPSYGRRITAWMNAFRDHLTLRGIDPSRFILAAVDESQSDATDLLTIAWTKAIKASDERFSVFVDPVWLRPDHIRHQESITTADIVCPRAGMVEKGGAPVWKYFENRRKAGQQLMFFSCYGPTRPADAAKYFRKLAWLAWVRQASGIGFWALGDLGGIDNSWNEYRAPMSSFSPLYLTPKDATNALQQEAIAEGVEDFQLLIRLRTLAESGEKSKAAEQAKELCREIAAQLGTVDLKVPKSVTEQFKSGWKSEDARKLDDWRDRALVALEEARASQP